MSDLNNYNSVQNLFYKTSNQIKWWVYAAWTLPFFALLILTIEKMLGLKSIYEDTIVITFTIFFTISIYWWWWAIDTIVKIVNQLTNAEKRILEIKQELHETRNILKEEI